jgi:4-hydroxythreonine-4-phosphate dehydrogenase
MIGISLGDVSGIGPEVTLKALAKLPAEGQTQFLILGSERCLRNEMSLLGLPLDLRPYAGPQSQGRFFFADAFEGELPDNLATGSPAAAQAAIAWLRDGAARCLRQELDALVTAPVNKESIIRVGQPFIGQTEFLSEIAGTSRTAMMLLGEDDRGRWLRVALATTHVPLRFVADHLRQEKIEMVIELAAQACHDLGLTRARVGVCGLNPHAGEGGALGDEEQSLIHPAVAAAKTKGIDVHGPFSADSLFYHAYRGDYEAVVAMYHDQGLVPLKMTAFETGVNWTLGLPFVRTSPDHGTGYDIAGKNSANPSSMLSAISLAENLVAGIKR